MRFIILLAFIIPSISNAGSWRAMDDPNSKAYASEALCDAAEAMACYNVTGKDPRYWKVEGGVLVPDTAAVAARDAAAADQASREAAIPARLTAIDTCISDSDTGVMTLVQVTACLRAMSRQMRKYDVPVEDL